MQSVSPNIFHEASYSKTVDPCPNTGHFSFSPASQESRPGMLKLMSGDEISQETSCT